MPSMLLYLPACFMYKEIAMMNTGILSMNFYFFFILKQW